MAPPEEKRMFFGMDVDAPWPDSLPPGRILDESNRHLTFAFLGNVDCQKIESLLPYIPLPSFTLGFVGKFDQCLFFPPKHPRVAAWHVVFLEERKPLDAYMAALINWLAQHEIPTDQRHLFNPHVTLARAPFNQREWEKNFSPLPLCINNICLYESLGNSRYGACWKHPLLLPYEELEHTADIAYLVRGMNLPHLFQHAQAALCFSFPQLLDFVLPVPEQLNGIEDVVIALNEIVTRSDHAIGCPFKAVSFHGKVEEQNSTLQWEMIIDV